MVSVAVAYSEFKSLKNHLSSPDILWRMLKMSDTPNNPPNNPMTQHGAFSWNELMTTDLDGAKTFYSQLFNWQFEDVLSDMPYTMAKVNNQESAGLMPLPPEAKGMPPMWGSYVTVDDVEASAKQAEELGGKIILEPRDIPNVGAFV